MYYSFPKGQNHTAELIFVSLAVSKDAAKEHLNHVYSTGSEIVATDGHRLHHYKPEVCILPEGYYQVKKRTKTAIELLKVEESMQYPDFTRVMPDRSKARPFPTKRRNGDQVCIEGKFAEVLRAMGAGALDYKYFEQANAVTMCSYFVDGGTSPVLLSGFGVTAVIMPLNYLGHAA